MRNIKTTSLSKLILALSLAPLCSHAERLTTIVVQGVGANWSQAIWQTNGVGVAVSPVAGNTYQCVPNGTAVGNNQNETRIRNPASAGIQTFPGDSLTLNTNTEIRAKAAGAILDFPGVNGNPGLILNGGMLNAGDPTVFTVTGNIRVDAQSYICPGNNDGQSVDSARGFIIAGRLTGAGTMVIFEAATNNAQQITGNSNAFSGEWIVKAGLLQGVGQDSLGTNSITIDPGMSCRCRRSRILRR